MIKRLGALTIILALLIFLVSCESKDIGAKDVISAIGAKCPSSSVGRVYLSEAAIGEDEYISDRLISALFGDGAYPQELECVESYAIRISSFASPDEYAVFKAKTVDDTAEIVKMCRRRQDAVRTLINKSGTTAEKEIAESAKVCVTGRFVLFVMTGDNESVIDAAASVIN